MLNLEQYGFKVEARSPSVEKEHAGHIVRRVLDSLAKDRKLSIYSHKIDSEESENRYTTTLFMSCPVKEDNLDIIIEVQVIVDAYKGKDTARASCDFDIYYKLPSDTVDHAASGRMHSGSHYSIHDENFKELLKGSVLSCYDKASRDIKFLSTVVGDKIKSVFNKKVHGA